MASLNFPALLLMGPPHSGKSVLAYHLARYLRSKHIAHFLLRTAPDGEGNWFYEGPPKTVVRLRLEAKGRYTPELVARMVHIIQHRHQPLLVDMGGKPRGEQWQVLKACTHGVLLYKSRADLDFWMPHIRRAGLQLLALLETRLEGRDRVRCRGARLEGVITGLHRHQPHLGDAFYALARRVARLFQYHEEELMRFHKARAPYPFLNEWDLARALGKPLPPWWEPEDLPELFRHIARNPVALYGRGPTWLAAAVAARIAPKAMALFDAHLGWVRVPELTQQSQAPVEVRTEIVDGVGWLKIRLKVPFLFPQSLPYPAELPETPMLVLWGKMPRWMYAAYARALVPQYVALAVWEPRREGPIVVYRKAWT